ncbi:hypothetical protein ES705_18606 [subsurface metagenome]
MTVEGILGVIVELSLDNELGARLQQLVDRFDTVEVQVRPLVPVVDELETLLTPTPEP